MDISKSIQDVVNKEAEAISRIKVTEQYEKVVVSLASCQGKVITTGMGKAGYVAQKFAATLCSTKTPSAFIHPGEAAHGDLGLIDEKDCIMAFSTSGKTIEVLEMLELSRHLSVRTIIGITSHSDSGLRELSDVIIDMGVIEEACPLGLTPSSSMAVMSTIGDAIALALMAYKGVTKEDYGLRHHGGYLGKKSRINNVQPS